MPISLLGDAFFPETRMLHSMLSLSGLSFMYESNVDLMSKQGIQSFKEINPASPACTVCLVIDETTLIADPICLAKSLGLKYDLDLWNCNAEAVNSSMRMCQF